MRYSRTEVSGRLRAPLSADERHRNPCSQKQQALRTGLLSSTSKCKRLYARSCKFAPVACLAQFAQQKKRPPTSTPWPMMWQLQCSQIGAIR